MLPQKLLKDRFALGLAIMILVVIWSLPVVASAIDAESHQESYLGFSLVWSFAMALGGVLIYRRSQTSLLTANLVLVLAMANLALLYRTPYIFVQPQFTSEDATVFFAQQHELGWSAFLVPYHGYYHTVVRLWAELVSPVPTLFVPAFYSLAWLGVYSLAVGYILLQYPDKKLAPIIALVPAFVSHSCEVFLVVTYASWMGGLALTAFILLPVPKLGKAMRYVLAGFILLFALSGPSGLLLTPFFLLRWMVSRKSFPFIYVIAVFIGAFVQVTALSSYYSQQPPGAPLTLSNLLLAFKIGVIRVPWSLGVGYQPQESYWLIGLVAFAVLFAFIVRDIMAEPRKHIFTIGCFVLGALFVASSLRRITPLDDLIPLLNGGRYFYIPSILLVWALIHLASTVRNPKPYYVALFFCAMGSMVQFTTTQVMVDNHWPRYAVLIDEGQSVDMPVNPPGWTAHIAGQVTK